MHSLNYAWKAVFVRWIFQRLCGPVERLSLVTSRLVRTRSIGRSQDCTFTSSQTISHIRAGRVLYRHHGRDVRVKSLVASQILVHACAVKSSSAVVNKRVRAIVIDSSKSYRNSSHLGMIDSPTLTRSLTQACTIKYFDAIVNNHACVCGRVFQLHCEQLLMRRWLSCSLPSPKFCESVSINNSRFSGQCAIRLACF